MKTSIFCKCHVYTHPRYQKTCILSRLYSSSLPLFFNCHVYTHPRYHYSHSCHVYTHTCKNNYGAKKSNISYTYFRKIVQKNVNENNLCTAYSYSLQTLRRGMFSTMLNTNMSLVFIYMQSMCHKQHH